MRPKGRPIKYRTVGKLPRISQFSPRGRPGRPDETELKMDEFEAIKLADFDLLDQQQAAKAMHISQQTFSRILRRARRQLAEGLVKGKIIRIQGGSYIIKSQKFLHSGTTNKVNSKEETGSPKTP